MVVNVNLVRERFGYRLHTWADGTQACSYLPLGDRLADALKRTAVEVARFHANATEIRLTVRNDRIEMKGAWHSLPARLVSA